ncbi:methylmalonyl-CoA mutase [Chloroflexota bacterium]
MGKELRESLKAWEDGILKGSLPSKGEQEAKFVTDSGIEVNGVYTPLDLEQCNFDYLKDLGFPGQYPFTRGITPTMYRGDPWVISQYSGYGGAEETNRWYKYLLDKGATAISMALDLPTQLGYDSDYPMASGEVGRCGVAINSLRDMEIIFDGIPLSKVKRVSTTANSMGAIFFAWILALAEKQGVPLEQVQLRLQNDPLKEYVARGTQIFPPHAGIKFANDVVEFATKQAMESVYPLTVSGYHMREAGATAAQEIAFALANAIAYVEEALGRGLKIDDFAPNIWLFMGVWIDFFEEIAKLRACRRMWAKLMKERFGARNPQSMIARLHAFTQGSAFTAQQPLNNIARGSIMGLAGVLAGIQSLTISSFDEALGLPSEESARVEIRTQQIIAHESGVIRTVDPLAGSYFVEKLTHQVEEAASGYMKKIEAMGGAVAAIERGYYQREIVEGAYQREKDINDGDRVIVGVNAYQSDEPIKIKIRRISARTQQQEIRRLKALKRERDNREVRQKLQEVREAAKRNENTILAILGAVKAYATTGEICDVLRDVWGEYRED